jgi:hypothetical protein
MVITTLDPDPYPDSRQALIRIQYGFSDEASPSVSAQSNRYNDQLGKKYLTWKTD